MGLGQEKHLAWKMSIRHLPSGHGYPWESASDPESPQPQPSWVPCEASLNRNLRAGEVGVCPSSAEEGRQGGWPWLKVTHLLWPPATSGWACPEEPAHTPGASQVAL